MYYEENRSARTPPIPTAIIAPPGERNALERLHDQLYHPDAHLEFSAIDDVMRRLWKALRTVQMSIARSGLPWEIFGAPVLVLPSQIFTPEHPLFSLRVRTN